jgi:hypothetical protein
LPGTAGRQRIAGGLTKFSTKPRPVGAADLLVHLRSLGGFIEIADPEELNFALHGYLHNDADAAQYFGRRRERAPPRKLTAPIRRAGKGSLERACAQATAPAMSYLMRGII